MSYSMWNPSCPTRHQTHAPCSGSIKPEPLDHQGNPRTLFFEDASHWVLLTGKEWPNLLHFRKITPVLLSSLRESQGASRKSVPPSRCSVTQSCPTLCDPTDCSMPGFPVLYHLSEFAQTHVHWVGDAIQPSRSLSFPSGETKMGSELNL